MSPDTEIPLVEREQPLAALHGALQQVLGGGPGLCVLVQGEAGVGKTALLRRWRQESPALRWLWGGCEPMLAPLPMAPLLECAALMPPDLAEALRSQAAPAAVFAGVLELLRDTRRPTVLVVEDAHWADGATLDLLRFIGRRIEATRSLMVVTYREDGAAEGHPLVGVTGALPPARTLRLALQPLSRAAVEAWARRRGRAPGELHRVTGGNPFFVGELLEAGAGPLPATVRDAVLARAARLPPPARELLVLASAMPSHLEHELLHELLDEPGADEAVAQACASGLLVADEAGLALRHELARQAIEQSLQPARRRRLHARVLAALAGHDVPLARRVHHAERAGLDAEVGTLAPRAAQQASAAGAHRQAAALLGLALERVPPADTARRATLLEQRAHCWMLANAFDAAITDRRAALALHEALADAAGTGRNRLWLARLHWMHDGDVAAAMHWAERAIAGLEGAGDSRELADAYSTRSHLHLVADDMDGTLQWGRRALALAQARGEPQPLAHALNNVGTALARRGETAEGLETLQRSLRVALDAGLHEDAARAHLNLFLVLAAQRRLEPGLVWADAGVNHAEAHGLDLYTVRLRIRRAYAHMLAGRFEAAEEDLATVERLHDPSPMEAATARFVGAVLDVRRGRDGAREALQGAVAAMRQHHTELWFTHSGTALAEAAWLAGDLPAARAAAEQALPALRARADAWRWAEAAVWLQRAHGRVPPVPGAMALPPPQAAECAGDADAAAAAWQACGCPYDEALALLASSGGRGERAARAVAQLRALGAGGALAAAQRLAGRDRRTGARGVYGHARGDPLGLTAREREVLECLRQGLSNQDIAQRWHRSTRTVEHHVATLLAKLGARDRQHAVRLAGGAP